jgi:hypothetical protein
MIELTAHIAYRVTGDPVSHGHRSASLRSADASLVRWFNSKSRLSVCQEFGWVQFTLPGRTVDQSQDLPGVPDDTPDQHTSSGQDRPFHKPCYVLAHSAD